MIAAALIAVAAMSVPPMPPPDFGCRDNPSTPVVEDCTPPAGVTPSTGQTLPRTL